MGGVCQGLYEHKLFMKTIVAISATGRRGKTSSIVELAKKIQLGAPEYFNYYTHDRIDAPIDGWVLCRGKFNGKTVGLSSEGDKEEIVNSGLCLLTDNFTKDIDVIVAACLTLKSTPEAIWEVAKRHCYEVIWTSNYCGKTPNNNIPDGKNVPVLSNGTDLNDIFAENTLNLIKELLK